MPAENEDVAPAIDEAVAERLRDGRGVVGSYVLIAEVVHEEGTELRVVSSGEMSPWQMTGMLMHAQEYASMGAMYEFDEDDD